MLSSCDISGIIREAPEAQTSRVNAAIAASSVQHISFSKTARAAVLIGAGEVGRACKVAFIFGIESDPVVEAKFLAKLTLPSRHSHIPPNTSKLRLAKNYISLKAVSDAFDGMSKKSAAHRDGWT